MYKLNINNLMGLFLGGLKAVFRKPIILTLLVLLVLVLIKSWQIYSSIKQHSKFSLPATAVTTIEAVKESWPEVFRAVGSVVAEQGAMLSTESSGTVSKISFVSGQEVKQGHLLLTLDTTVEDGDLKAASAQKDLARQNLVRIETLMKGNASSRSDLERATAETRSAEAQVAALAGKIERKKVIAPFSGRTGVRLVNVGQYVTSGTPIVSLVNLEKVYVNLSLPQRFAQKLKIGLKVGILGPGLEREYLGILTAFDPEISSVTRNFTLQATFNNPDGQLLPGMFVTVQLYTGKASSFITIPSTAVSYAPYGNSVYVIESAQTLGGLIAKGLFVKLGESRGDRVAVLEGLEEGQIVVSSGTSKLRPNVPVVINNSVAPSNSLTPLVKDS